MFAPRLELVMSYGVMVKIQRLIKPVEDIIVATPHKCFSSEVQLQDHAYLIL